MSVTTRDVAIWTAAMLAFPVAIHVTAFAASDGAPHRPEEPATRVAR